MTYIALKPCSFAGLSYRIGDSVPDAVLHPGAIKSLISMGVIASGDGTQPVANATSPTAGAQSPAKTEIHVEVEEGTLALEITAEGLQGIFTAMCGNVEKAEDAIEEMTDVDALVLLALADNRKTVKTAAEDRAKALSEETTPEESEDAEGEQPNESEEDTEGEETTPEESEESAGEQ